MRDVTSCKQAMTLAKQAIDFVAQSNCMIWEDFNYSAQDKWTTFMDIFLVLLIMVPAAVIALQSYPFMFWELGVL